MFALNRFIATASLALCSSLVMAQTSYEKIEVGTVLTSAGIGLGALVKPIPLPAGEWLVVSRHVDDIQLTRGLSTAAMPTPEVWLTLKNNNPEDALLFAMVVSFTPEASNVNWGNADCESKNPKVLADDFGSKSDSMRYLCAHVFSFSGHKAIIAKVSGGTNAWMKSNLSELAAYRNEIPDNALWVVMNASQYKGRKMGFVFFIKRQGDLFTDPVYTQYVKDWTHATGLSLAKVLDRNTAEFALPTPYAATP